VRGKVAASHSPQSKSKKLNAKKENSQTPTHLLQHGRVVHARTRLVKQGANERVDRGKVDGGRDGGRRGTRAARAQAGRQVRGGGSDASLREGNSASRATTITLTGRHVVPEPESP
jgi:hypothetical protein